MKRIITVILSLCMIISTLAGCVKKPVKEETPNTNDTTETTELETTKEGLTGTLEIALYEGGFSKFWDAYVERFKSENPNLDIKVISSPKLSDAIRPRFMTDDVPDFVSIPIYPELDPRVLAQEGALLDLTEFFNETQYNGTSLNEAIWEGVLDVGIFDDNKIALAPLTVGMTGVFYNKKMANDLGVNEPKTYDELLEIGEVINEKAPDKSLYIYPGQYPYYITNMQFWSTILSTPNGTDLYERMCANEEGVWESDEVKRFFGYMETIANDELVPMGVTAINHTQSQQEFLTGKAFCIPNGNWLEAEMSDAEITDFEWGFIPSLTYGKEDQSCISGSIETMFIPTKAKNPEAAKAFLAGIYTEETIKMASEMAGAIVPVNNVNDLIGDTLSVSVKEILDAQARTNSKYRVVGLPAEYAPIEDAINKSLTAIMNKDITAEQAIKDIQAVADSL